MDRGTTAFELEILGSHIHIMTSNKVEEIGLKNSQCKEAEMVGRGKANKLLTAHTGIPWEK